MRRILLLVLGACGSLLFGCSDSPSTTEATATVTEDAPADAAAQFVGTWKLVDIERRSASGEIIPSENEPIGFIMYDPAGHMGVVIQGSNRQPYAGERATPEEALAALTSYTSYFGTFTVDPEEGAVTHHLVASSNPSGAGSDYRRTYELSGDRITLEPPAGPSGNTVRLTWERVPDLAELTAEHRRFVGFWKFASIERTDDTGALVPVSDPYETGYIIYTSSGHMAVHLARPNRETYSATQPTPEEALAALRSYASYFGPVTIHEADGYVVHHRIGNLHPGLVGTDAQRYYDLSDDTLILKPPPTTVDGRTLQSALTWERLRG